MKYRNYLILEFPLDIPHDALEVNIIRTSGKTTFFPQTMDVRILTQIFSP